MTSDRDIFHSAQVLVKRHGQDAPIEAAITPAGLLDGSMGSAFVCIALLLASCSTGSAPTSLRRR